MDRLDLLEGETVSLVTDASDGIDRQVAGFIVHAYNIPEGCILSGWPFARVAASR
jgi:hypothetical protein